jgi:hypothetical protein
LLSRSRSRSLSLSLSLLPPSLPPFSPPPQAVSHALCLSPLSLSLQPRDSVSPKGWSSCHGAALPSARQTESPLPPICLCVRVWGLESTLLRAKEASKEGRGSRWWVRPAILRKLIIPEFTALLLAPSPKPL